jgi:hypothetical protein
MFFANLEMFTKIVKHNFNFRLGNKGELKIKTKIDKFKNI